MSDIAPHAHPGGWYRSLWPGEDRQLAALLKSLPAEDRRQRFLNAVTDDWIEHYVARARRSDRRVIGWFRDGALGGAAEVYFDGSAAECAVTVAPGDRSRGIGSALMERALRAARNRGIRRLTVVTGADNGPMLRIARSLGARLTAADGVVTGEIAPGLATPASLVFDLAEEERGLLAGWWAALGWLAPQRPAG